MFGNKKKYRKHIENVYLYENDPELYLEREKAIKKEEIKELVAAVGIVVMIALAVIVVQVGCGIW